MEIFLTTLRTLLKPRNWQVHIYGRFTGQAGTGAKWTSMVGDSLHLGALHLKVRNQPQINPKSQMSSERHHIKGLRLHRSGHKS